MPEVEPILVDLPPQSDESVITPAPKSPYLIPLLVTLLVVITLSSYYYLKVTYPSLFSSFLKSTSPSPSPSPSMSPLPSPRPIPHGPKDFTIGQGDKTVPQFSKGTIDPYDPAVGSTQKMTISLKHSSPIKSVTATIVTDHMVSLPQPFKLISGTDKDGVWEGSWTMGDSYLYTYAVTLKAQSNKNASVEITLR